MVTPLEDHNKTATPQGGGNIIRNDYKSKNHKNQIKTEKSAQVLNAEAPRETR
jgi:hypothetical protein